MCETRWRIQSRHCGVNAGSHVSAFVTLRCVSLVCVCVWVPPVHSPDAGSNFCLVTRCWRAAATAKSLDLLHTAGLSEASDVCTICGKRARRRSRVGRPTFTCSPTSGDKEKWRRWGSRGRRAWCGGLKPLPVFLDEEEEEAVYHQNVDSDLITMMI